MRREHLHLLLEQGVTRADADVLARCHEDSTSPRERALAAEALLLSDRERGERAILSNLRWESRETAWRLLVLLGQHEGEARDGFLDAVDRLVDALLAHRDEIGDRETNLGYGLCTALKAGGRKGDLTRLLALSRSTLSCRSQALVDLKEATQESWEALDPRWDELVGRRRAGK